MTGTGCPKYVSGNARAVQAPLAARREVRPESICPMTSIAIC
jgi:hypothetical protein